MTRKTVIYTDRGPSVFRNVRKDRTGEPLVLLDEDEATKLVLDFTSYLQTGETITAATARVESCTATLALASPLITLTIGNSVADDQSGKITVEADTSSGEAMRHVIRVRRTQRYTDNEIISDYE